MDTQDGYNGGKIYTSEMGGGQSDICILLDLLDMVVEAICFATGVLIYQAISGLVDCHSDATHRIGVPVLLGADNTLLIVIFPPVFLYSDSRGVLWGNINGVVRAVFNSYHLFKLTPPLIM